MVLLTNQLSQRVEIQNNAIFVNNSFYNSDSALS